jgi:uncharacterized membrane protein
VVADLKAGRTPDAKYGKIAKLRSTHNNYLTLPVVFLMLSTHYPLAFATEWNWVIASLVFLIGVVIRHFFNTMHARQGRPHWTWAVAVLLFIAIAWLSSRGPELTEEADAAVEVSGGAADVMNSEGFAEVADIVRGRCSMCHTAEPVWPGLYWAPKGVHLDRDADIARRAREIYLQAGASSAMPPGNVSFMEVEERRRIAAWFEAL